jgi:hypothetical protein
MPVPPCADELRKVYDAIMALSTGKQTTSVSFGERSVSYSQAQLNDLRATYSMFYAQCGASSGLPDLSSVQRGAPAIARFT